MIPPEDEYNLSPFEGLILVEVEGFCFIGRGAGLSSSSSELEVTISFFGVMADFFEGVWPSLFERGSSFFEFFSSFLSWSDFLFFFAFFVDFLFCFLSSLFLLLLLFPP